MEKEDVIGGRNALLLRKVIGSSKLSLSCKF